MTEREKLYLEIEKLFGEFLKNKESDIEIEHYVWRIMNMAEFVLREIRKNARRKMK